MLPQPARELNMACHDRILTWIACVLFSSALFSAAVSAVPVLLYPALQPLHAQFLHPAQAMLCHFALALYDMLASSPMDVPPGQPAGVAAWYPERQATGCAGYHTLSGTSGCPIHVSPDGGGIIA